MNDVAFWIGEYITAAREESSAREVYSGSCGHHGQALMMQALLQARERAVDRVNHALCELIDERINEKLRSFRE